MPNRTILFCALLLCIAAPAAWGAGLSLPGHRIPIEGEGLGRSMIFARIDSLESWHRDAQGSERADLAMRLGQLYLATDLKKHRRVALDYLESSLGEGSDPFTASRLRAATAHRMRYTGDAQKWIDRLIVTYPDNPRSYFTAGTFYFLEARRRLLVPEFRRSQAAFARAVRADSTFVDGWVGWAAASLAIGDHQTALDAARGLGRLRPDRIESLFFEGAAYLRLGQPEAAFLAFDEAIARSDPDQRAVFEVANGFLDAVDLELVAKRNFPRQAGQQALKRLGEDPRLGEDLDWKRALADSLLRQRAVQAFWAERNSRPTRTFNPRQLRYWNRLVDADVLFGDPDSGRRGWETSMGDALVRWGRPTSTFYEPGGTGSLISDLDAAGIEMAPGENVPHGVPVWIWSYRKPGMNFSLTFTDLSRNARWTYGDFSAQYAATLRRQSPIHLPEPPEPPAPFRLAVSRAIFPRGNDSAVLETYISLRPTEEFILAIASLDSAQIDSLAVVEWALYDADDRRLDFRRERLGDANRRDLLHSRIGWFASDRILDPYVLPIGARLPAGRYRIAVEAFGPDGRGHDGLSLDVVVPGTEPPSILEMSDLQLATAYGPYDPEQSVPLRYVKFGQVVIPAADLRVPSGAPSMAVYFELRHLAQDEFDRTSFDVSYEIFASTREVRSLTQAGDFDPRGLSLVQPASLTFLQERTGVSEEGLVVKGTKVDIADLSPGNYVLVVTVSDRISQRVASRALPFRKRGR